MTDTMTPRTSEDVWRDAYDRLEKNMRNRLDKVTVAILLVLAVFIGFSLALSLVKVTAKPPSAEVTFADQVTAEFPQLERVDALMYGWMVCDSLGNGWTEWQAASWLAGEPAKAYGIDDPLFGRFVVDAALPMCPTFQN